MGIRIKKNLCFSLGNVKCKNYRIDDLRFQEWVCCKDSEEFYSRPQKRFIPFLEWIVDESKEAEHIEILAEANGPSTGDKYGIRFGILSRAKKLLSLPKEDQKQFLNENFNIDPIYQSEYGISKIFGIAPPEEFEFKRSDDSIDYYENCGIPKNKVKWLDHRSGMCGIYPHNMMVRIPYKDKIQIRECDLIGIYLPNYLEDQKYLPDRLNGGDYNRLVGLWDKKHQPLVGNALIKTIKETYRPEIFSSVLLWTHYLDLFKDWAKTVNELRPCIYTYWS